MTNPWCYRIFNWRDIFSKCISLLLFYYLFFIGNTHFRLYFKSEFVSEERASEKYPFFHSCQELSHQKVSPTFSGLFLSDLRIRATGSPRSLQANTGAKSYNSLVDTRLLVSSVSYPDPSLHPALCFPYSLAWFRFSLRYSIWLPPPF